MKILTKYILKEISFPFILSFFLFTFLLFIDQIFQLTELVVNKGVNIVTVIKLFLLAFPNVIAVTIPIGLLCGVMMTFGRLCSDNEFTAMKTSGMNLIQIMKPVIIFSSILTFLMIGFNNTILPKANYSLKQLYFDLNQKHASIFIKEKIYIKDYQDGNLIFYVDKIDSKTSLMSNIIMYILKDNQLSTVILAKEGNIYPDQEKKNLFIKLRNGEIQRITKA
ncbi:MAG: LptF/LptG family permease, partial [bacterium]